jgi:fructosamine-3-kinase
LSPWQDIELAIREAEGAPFSIESRSAAGGGCINECCIVRGQGRAYFVKTNAPGRAEYPLDAGYATRKHLYNVYHVLNHLNLFGGGYGAQAERMMGLLLAAA